MDAIPVKITILMWQLLYHAANIVIQVIDITLGTNATYLVRMDPIYQLLI